MKELLGERRNQIGLAVIALIILVFVVGKINGTSVGTPGDTESTGGEDTFIPSAGGTNCIDPMINAPAEGYDEFCNYLEDFPEGSDVYLMGIQGMLAETYGAPPEGFLLDTDGTLIPLSDPSKTAEEIAFTFLRSLSTLDFETAARFSTNSWVVRTYDNYFDSARGQLTYSETFQRDMYKTALLSLTATSIKDTASFAGDKVTVTLNASMIDLADKNFWQEDKDEIYSALETYSRTESDSIKADAYLYNYLTEYYQGSEALRRDLEFTLTLEKNRKVASGWLVSIDEDLNKALKYEEGVLSINFIKEEFGEYLNEKLSG